MYCLSFFFFNDTATTEIYTLSLHDALPISGPPRTMSPPGCSLSARISSGSTSERISVAHGTSSRVREKTIFGMRSEEHTSELQSRQYLVCRLLLEKKKKHE